MPLTFTTPIGQPQFVKVDPLELHILFPSPTRAVGAVIAKVLLTDAQGGTSEVVRELGPAARNAFINGNSNAFYNELQAEFGAGTVT